MGRLGICAKFAGQAELQAAVEAEDGREREHLQARAADADRARALQRNLSQSLARRASRPIHP